MRRYPPPSQRNGSTRAWRATRARVLERDSHTCQSCGRPATHVDHRASLLMGGTDHDPNLQALCAHCNLTKGAA